jgi:hypothetical protein
MYRHLKILGITAAALFFLYVLLVAADRRGSPKTISSALLNEKYVSQVAVVRVTIPPGRDSVADRVQSGQVEVRRTGALWVFSPEAGITAPVAENRIQELLNAAARTRKMSVFADTPKNREALCLSQEKAIRVDFESETGQVFSSIYFGTEDFTRRNISLCSAKPANTVYSAGIAQIYQAVNDFAPWLTAAPELWADLRLIPECTGIKVPADILTTPLRPLLSYRGTGLLPVDAAEQLRQGERLNLTIEGGNGALVRLSFFAIFSGSKDIPRYAGVWNIRPGAPITPPEEQRALASLSYALEISPWTFGVIQGFIQPPD